MYEINHYELFAKEHKVLVNAKKSLETNNLSFDTLLDSYSSLVINFECLLNSFIKVLKVSDINERKLYHAKELINKQKEELEIIIANNKLLHGMLPICASCKKIRDDDGYWRQVETYISKRTDTKFSHSICPDCMKKIYPEFTEDEDCN
ncbi:hypothetical protein K8T06_18100 [bacterium]|nr:hypothetical protein [bacterium]